MEIPIGEMVCKLRIDTTRSRRRSAQHTTEVVYRWLKRAAQRVGKNTTRPSLRLENERDLSLQRTYLFGSVATFADTAPDWLENATTTGLTSIHLPDLQW